MRCFLWTVHPNRPIDEVGFGGHTPPMGARSARIEYNKAVADFERACRDFSIAMSKILEPDAAHEASSGNVDPMMVPTRDLGPRKPAKRARDMRETPAPHRKLG